MSHLCLRSIERALAAYTSRRYMASTANQKAAVSRGRRFLKREGTDTSASLAASHQAEPPQVTVSKFIMAHGNHGKDAKCLPKPPAGLAAPDSDDPDHDASSSDLTQDADKARREGVDVFRGIRARTFLYQ